MFTAGLTSPLEDRERHAGAINAMTCSEGGPDQSKEPGILQGPIRWRLLAPCVEAGALHLENLTHQLCTVLGLDEHR
jgi:hypothetical protein